ncbi:F-box domain-containing protein [Plasmodiophora brassicae]
MGLVAMMEHLPAQVVHRSLMPVLDLCTVNALLRVSRHMNQLLAPVSHGGVVRYAREVLAAADVAGDPTARANLQCLHAKLAGVLADLYARSLRNQACPAAFQERHRIVAAMETGLPHLPVPWIDVEGWQSSTAFLVAMQSGNYLLIKRHLRRIPPTRDNRRDDDEDAIVFYLRRPQGPDAVGYTVQIAFQLMHTGSAEPDSRREAWYSGLVNPAVLEDVLKELLGARGDRPDPVAAQAILESCPRSKQVVFRPSDHAVPSDGNLRDLSVFLACLRAMLPFWPPALHLDMYVIVVEYQPEPTGMDLSPFEFTQEPGPVRRACESILHRVVDVVRPAPRFFSCRRPDVAVQPFERNARSRPCRASLTYLLHRVFCEPLLGWSMASTVLGTMRLVRSAFALFNSVDPGNVGRAHRETAATLVRDGLVTYVDAVGAVINPFIVMQVTFTFAGQTIVGRQWLSHVDARERCGIALYIVPGGHRLAPPSKRARGHVALCDDALLFFDTSGPQATVSKDKLAELAADVNRCCEAAQSDLHLTDTGTLLDLLLFVAFGFFVDHYLIMDSNDGPSVHECISTTGYAERALLASREFQRARAILFDGTACAAQKRRRRPPRNATNICI